MGGKFRIATSRNGLVEVREEYFGSDPSKIVFPGLSSCLTITADSPHGLVGVHITVHTEDGIIDQMMTSLKNAMGNAYVIGQVQEFKLKRELKGFDTRKKIASRIARSIAGINKVYFMDIGTVSKNPDLLAEKNIAGIDFSWAPIRKISWEYNPDLTGFTKLNTQDFVVR